MDIIQSFYDSLASHYDKLFLDWQATTGEQAAILQKLFQEYGFDQSACILDCACGIGTQAIGLASLGFSVTASDISEGELLEASNRADRQRVAVSFFRADFRCLSDVFSQLFDIVICMDNALPHMLSVSDLESAIHSMIHQIKPGGIFIASIRDYDSLLMDKPSYSPPYIHRTNAGQRVAFQTWSWEDIHYKFTQYIIEDGEKLDIQKFNCEYRCIRREELAQMLRQNGCTDVVWKFPEETGFYQPIVIASK